MSRGRGMIGPNAARNPDVMRLVVTEGHRLCGHSVHHDTAMDRKPASYQHSGVVGAERIIECPGYGRSSTTRSTSRCGEMVYRRQGTAG
ncbi:polysaccharide deacetylase family protein [Streptomyces puniciscabiei]|uniref:hypothetical protein n=1 Tax=Streptomyces puniciscabiei TaxID=164348 RepID=UPI00114E5A79|nr:hypothetical protein [Streptomyces puniciscabiei]